MPGKLGNKINNIAMWPNCARPRTRSSAQAFARGFGGQTEKQTDGRSDAATPLASLAEVTGPSLHPGGTCLLGEPQKRVTRRMNRTIGGEKEGSMDQMIVCAVALLALVWWASVAPGRMVKERVYDLVACEG